MKLYRLFVLVLVILSFSSNAYAVDIIHPPGITYATHIDINDKCGVQHLFIQKGKSKEIKAELWGEKSGTISKHNEILIHEKLNWIVLRIDNHHYNLLSDNIRYTNMLGNSYQTFNTKNLEKGEYELIVNYYGGESSVWGVVYNRSGQSISITVT